LEIVAFYEFVQVHAQKFETEDQVLSENEFLLYSNDVLFVFGIIIPELFEDFSLYQALLVQPLFIS